MSVYALGRGMTNEIMCRIHYMMEQNFPHLSSRFLSIYVVSIYVYSMCLKKEISLTPPRLAKCAWLRRTVYSDTKKGDTQT